MPSASLASRLAPVVEPLRRLLLVAPREPKITIGLDVGSAAVKVIALGPRRGQGPRPIVGQHLVALTRGQENDAAAAIHTAVETLQLGTRAVNLAVSGQWVIMRVVEMPVMTPGEMVQALPFEAQRYLPFNVQEVVIDGAVLGPSDASKVWVLIVACKKELLQRRVDWAKQAGFEAALIDVDALALTNSFLGTVGARDLTGSRALINVGAQFTNLVVFRKDIPYLIRDIPWGGEKLARNAAEQLGSDADAVQRALTQGTADASLQSALKLTTEALVTELQLSFDYFENRFGEPPQELLISGGLSQSGAFIEALKSHLTQSVAVWTPIQGLSPQFAVAHGLAMRTS